jgi:hypothetical protein
MYRFVEEGTRDPGIEYRDSYKGKTDPGCWINAKSPIPASTKDTEQNSEFVFHDQRSAITEIKTDPGCWILVEGCAVQIVVFQLPASRLSLLYQLPQPQTSFQSQLPFTFCIFFTTRPHPGRIAMRPYSFLLLPLPTATGEWLMGEAESPIFSFPCSKRLHPPPSF